MQVARAHPSEHRLIRESAPPEIVQIHHAPTDRSRAARSGHRLEWYLPAGVRGGPHEPPAAVEIAGHVTARERAGTAGLDGREDAGLRPSALRRSAWPG